MVSGQSEFFSDFWIFFNLTRPLNTDMVVFSTLNQLCSGEWDLGLNIKICKMFGLKINKYE